MALEVLTEAEAKRKIIAFSGMSDSTQNDVRRWRGVGQSSAEIADLAVFVGDRAKYGVKGAVHAGMDPDRVRAFYDLESASEYLRAELREGDLVLLRGFLHDHMPRAYLAMLGEVHCWLPTCPKKIACDVCPELKACRWCKLKSRCDKVPNHAKPDDVLTPCAGSFCPASPDS